MLRNLHYFLNQKLISNLKLSPIFTNIGLFIFLIKPRDGFTKVKNAQ
jgi:hypothetical protein